MHPVLFSLGQGFVVHTYGVLVTVGYLVGAWIGTRDFRKSGQPPATFVGFALWALLGSFAGARLLYVIVTGGRIWEGGAVFLGGVLGALVALVVFVLVKRARPGPLVDAAALGLPFGHAFGRLGCFAAGCCFGKEWHGPFAVSFGPGSLASDPAATGTGTPPLFPTQPFEALLELGLGLALVFLRKRKRYHGQIALTWVVGYALVRTAVEVFRGDSSRGLVIPIELPSVAAWLGLERHDPLFLSTSQAISIVLALAAISLLATMALARRETRRA
ncbi:MAG: prolipoprotein diacylglyceryl transferase [Deltaproteobacteria bacterium]|nr:prolipoprotein diacylglyceryl transferase [Deltaproteobacteria bacterium]